MPKAMRRSLLLFAALLASFAPPCCFAQAPWPGQTGNPVGYAAYGSGVVGGTACPSRTSGTLGNPTIISNCTYSTAQTISQSYVWFFQVDVNSGTGSTQVSGSHDLFIGCRFQSNSVGNYNVRDSGTGNVFLYDSIVPLVSLYTSPPGYSTWPTSEAQQNTYTQTNGGNSVNGAQGYQYGILSEPSTDEIADHIDVWGFGNSIDYENGTNGAWLLNSWIHDAAYPGTQGYHLDGPGYLDGIGGTAPWNITIAGNAIESMANTNGLAMQQAPVGGNGYEDMQIIENLWGGFENTISPGDIGSQNFTNSPLVQNVYDTSIPNDPPGGAFHGTTLGTGSIWACNLIQIAPNTTWTNAVGWTPTSGENGQYWVLSSTAPASPTDQGGNTTCATTDPAAIDFLTQTPGTTSASKTVTLKNTGSTTLTISSVAMLSGANFAVASNGCGSSLTAGSSCTVSVTFTPGAKEVYSDEISITDSMPSSASPQLIPLVGVGLPGSGPAPGLPSNLLLMTADLRGRFLPVSGDGVGGQLFLGIPSQSARGVKSLSQFHDFRIAGWSEDNFASGPFRLQDTFPLWQPESIQKSAVAPCASEMFPVDGLLSAHCGGIERAVEARVQMKRYLRDTALAEHAPDLPESRFRIGNVMEHAAGEHEIEATVPKAHRFHVSTEDANRGRFPDAGIEDSPITAIKPERPPRHRLSRAQRPIEAKQIPYHSRSHTFENNVRIERRNAILFSEVLSLDQEMPRPHAENVFTAQRDAESRGNFGFVASGILDKNPYAHVWRSVQPEAVGEGTNASGWPDAN